LLALEILKNTFVDNVELGANTIAELITKAITAKAIFNEAKMDLRNFYSNSPEVSAAMDTEIPEKTSFLGISWLPKSDMIIAAIPKFKPAATVTKRVVLSAVASIYDPLGLLSPVVLNAKSFIQSLWKENYSWDKPLEPLQRCIISPEAKNFEQCTFSDASVKGICAVSYLRQQLKNDDYIANILDAKSRVTDVEKSSIPRLELTAAHVGSSLNNYLCYGLVSFINKPRKIYR
jgi:hypothetical protein